MLRVRTRLFPITALIGLIGLIGTIACFDGEGLRGAPCIDDADCGPKLACLGPQGASVCGGSGPDTVTSGRWPDSASIFCTDGSTDLSACPAPGELGHGQDGNYQIAVPSYAENDGIIRDSVTLLDWESGSSNAEYTQGDALARCDDIQLEGRDWRLPSRLELASLLNFGRVLPFSGLYAGAHWTSSTTANADEAWVIGFIDWTTVVQSSSDQAFVICVTGEPLISSFTMTELTLRDGLTGLEWQRARPDSALAWTEALDACEGLDFAEHADWRLPSAKELLTLVRDDQQLVAGFDGDGDLFWSASPDWPPTNAVTVAFPSGTTGSDDAQFPNHLRCVRGPD
jgi:hypothetical protein